MGNSSQLYVSVLFLIMQPPLKETPANQQTRPVEPTCKPESTQNRSTKSTLDSKTGSTVSASLDEDDDREDAYPPPPPPPLLPYPLPPALPPLALPPPPPPPKAIERTSARLKCRMREC